MKLSSPFTLLLLGTIANVATGASILWTLPQVTMEACCVFDDTPQFGTFSGAFLFDWEKQSYSDWKFEISGFTGPLANLNGTLTPATSSRGGDSSSRLLDLSWNHGETDMPLAFGFWTSGGFVPVPLTSFGGEIPFFIGGVDFVVPCCVFSFSAHGDVLGTVSSVPEPVAGVLVLAVAVILCISKRPRFRRNASVDPSHP